MIVNEKTFHKKQKWLRNLNLLVTLRLSTIKKQLRIVCYDWSLNDKCITIHTIKLIA